MWLWLEKSGFYKAVQTTARFDGKCSSFEYLCFEIIFCDRFSSLILIGGGRRLGLLNWYHFVCFSSCLYDTGCDVRVCHGDNQERKSSYDADPHHWGHWLRHRGMQTLTQGQKHRGEPSRQNGGLSQTRPWDEQVCDLLYHFQGVRHFLYLIFVTCREAARSCRSVGRKKKKKGNLWILRLWNLCF